MSKVVKFYYTRPLSFLEVAIVPIRETVAVPQQKTRMSERYTIAAIYDEEAKTISLVLQHVFLPILLLKGLVEKLLKREQKLNLSLK